MNRPDGVSQEAWNRHCNLLAQGWDSDPHEAERTVQAVNESLHNYDIGVGRAVEKARQETEAIDNFFHLRGDGSGGSSGYYEQPVMVYEDGGKRGGSWWFPILCALALILGVIAGQVF